MRLAALLFAAAFPSAAAAQPDLGHKIPGTAGLDAGTQPPPGLYLANRFLYYDAVSLRDRHGERVKLPGFDTDAIANAVGLAATLELDSGLHLSAAVAIPYARLWVSVDDDRATVDRFGLGDIFVEPIQLGGRWPRADLVTSYAFYAPTRQLGREGLGAPQWAHQFSVGGTLYLDENRRWRASALVSYDLHQKKLGIDVTRGDSVQIQGGVGGAIFENFEIGLAGYALWQIRDDRGSDLPAALRGRRDRVFGLGPEISVRIPAIRTKIGLRYARDFGVEGRPEGQIVVVDVAIQLWSPG